MQETTCDLKRNILVTVQQYLFGFDCLSLTEIFWPCSKLTWFIKTTSKNTLALSNEQSVPSACCHINHFKIVLCEKSYWQRGINEWITLPPKLSMAVVSPGKTHSWITRKSNSVNKTAWNFSNFIFSKTIYQLGSICVWNFTCLTKRVFIFCLRLK